MKRFNFKTGVENATRKVNNSTGDAGSVHDGGEEMMMDRT